MVAKLDAGLRPDSARQRDTDDFAIGDEDAHRDAEIACRRLRRAFEECETDVAELPSFRPLARGVPRAPRGSETPLPFSRARALSSGDAPLGTAARAAPGRDAKRRSLRPFLLTVMFLAGTIAGLGGAVAARVDRLDVDKIEQARRALSSLVDSVAWREASGAGGLAARPRALPTRVESPLPADTASANGVPHPSPPAAAARADAIPVPPAGPPAASFALERGDEAMRQRDVIAARRFYEFAASAGVAGAASALARTYDPIYLQQHGLRGVKADTEVALHWYKRASAEADRAARPR